MTITAAVTRNNYIAGASQTVYPYTFFIAAASELLVYAGNTLLSLGVHYNVTGAGMAGGGNVVFTAVWAPLGSTVVILGRVALDQQTDYIEHNPFPAVAHEGGLDKLTRLMQQHEEAFARTPKLHPYSQHGFISIDEPVSNGVLRYSASTNTIESFQLVIPTISTPLPNGSINVQDYGAVGDDSTDNAAAIAAAIAACPWGGTLVFPPGTYRYTGTIVVNKIMTIQGTNTLFTTLVPMTNNAPGISVTSSWVRLQDFHMTRVVQPIIGGDGIVTGSDPLSNLYFTRLLIQKQYRGVQLCPCDIARFSDSTIQYCDSHGMACNYGTYGALQWYVINVLSQSNLGDGFNCVNTTAGNGIGPFMIDCASFHNALTGFYFHGSPSFHLSDVLLLRPLTGSEGVCGIHFDDPWGTGSTIHDSWVELIGQLGGFPRGFAGALSVASGIGHGIRISGNHAGSPPNIVGGFLWTSSWSGLSMEAVNVHAVGLTLLDNGLSADANIERRAGIVIKADGCHVSACRFIKTLGGQIKGVTVGAFTLTDVGIDASNHFSGYGLGDMVDTSLATFSGTVPARAPLGLQVNVGRVALNLFNEGGGTNPSKTIRVGSTGVLEILNDAASAIIFAIRNNGVVEIPATTGALKLPVLTTTQRDALTAEDAMHIYNITLGTAQYRKAGVWVSY